MADTGSTDGTIEALRVRGATVHNVTLKPFRFDKASGRQQLLTGPRSRGRWQLCDATSAQSLCLLPRRGHTTTAHQPRRVPGHNGCTGQAGGGAPVLAKSAPPCLQARNAALAKLPTDCDLCIGIDLDDQLQVLLGQAGGPLLPSACPGTACVSHVRRPPCAALPACLKSQPVGKPAGLWRLTASCFPELDAGSPLPASPPALQPGWLEALRDVWAKSWPKPVAVRYRYVWRFEADGVTPLGAAPASHDAGVGLRPGCRSSAC